ncbi:MAG TPA: ATP-binding protein [Flavisolibacter sp.]|jgi:signal transduction histidine kinase|nr:ATP-binding protein [Flavisolibacter sp.]
MGPSNDQDLIIAVITATLLFFLFSAFTVAYFLVNRRKQKQHQLQMDAFKKEFEQQLQQAQIEVQENTYRHIAKELHDNVGQLLGTTKMLIAVTEKKLGFLPETLSSANATLGKAIQEIRFLSRSMDKEWLEQFNFLDNLNTEVGRLNAGEVIHATVHCSTQIVMKPEEQIILFRIVQEAIQNAVRHAGPTQLDVIITGNAEALEVKVANNGTPLPQNFHGMGTNNMRQRARLFGGTVHWLPVQEGTVVTIYLPSKKTA